MEYTKLGNTGLTVSKLCLGCMSFGDASRGFQSGWLLDELESRKIIKKALDIGINFFDTANGYGYGSSEEYLGRAICDYAKREDIVIATKAFFGDSPEATPNTIKLSRKALFYQVNRSLERLGTDYIDLLYIHRWDHETPIRETMEALHDLIKSGKVLYIGASAMYTWQFQKAQYTAEKHGWTPFVAMQSQYNIIYREEEREMIPFCQDYGVALVPYSPLAAGRLVRDWDSDSPRSRTDAVSKAKFDTWKELDYPIVQRVYEIAHRHGVARSAVALAWLWQKGVTSPIVGVTKEGYLEELEKALSFRLTLEEIAYLDELYGPHPLVGVPSTAGLQVQRADHKGDISS